MFNKTPPLDSKVIGEDRHDDSISVCSEIKPIASLLQEYTEKLQKVYVVRQEVKSHIQNLPDLTQLPDVTGGLAPLPSAGDLFSMH